MDRRIGGQRAVHRFGRMAFGIRHCAGPWRRSSSAMEIRFYCLSVLLPRGGGAAFFGTFRRFLLGEIGLGTNRRTASQPGAVGWNLAHYRSHCSVRLRSRCAADSTRMEGKERRTPSSDSSPCKRDGGRLGNQPRRFHCRGSQGCRNPRKRTSHGPRLCRATPSGPQQSRGRNKEAGRPRKRH